MTVLYPVTGFDPRAALYLSALGAERTERGSAPMTSHAYQGMADEELADHLDRNGYHAGADRLRAGEDRTEALRAEYADDADPRYDDDEARGMAEFVRGLVGSRS